jgi:hypothetical protein
LEGILVDKMSLTNILLVGIPNVFIVLLFGIILYQSDYFKNKDKGIMVLKSIISTTLILWALTYIRAILQSVLYIGFMSMILYLLVLMIIWKLNVRSALFCSIMIVFLSSATENIYTPLFLKLSETSNIFTQSRVLMSLPIEITELFIILIVYYSKINIGNLHLFKNKWTEMTLSNKITSVFLIIFVLTGFIISCSYTDVLIKVVVFKINIDVIYDSIKYMFYGVLLLISSGLLIISRTKSYEDMKQEVKNIKEVFNLPPEQLFLNILRASNPEDIPKYKEVFTNYIMEGGEKNGKS